MNLREGLRRLWIVGSLVWALCATAGFLALAGTPHRYSFGEFLTMPAAFGVPPLIAYAVGEGVAWAIAGFRVNADLRRSIGEPARSRLVGVLGLLGALLLLALMGVIVDSQGPEGPLFGLSP